MKKCMVLGVAAMAAFGALADAQVYEMSMTLKSTVTAKGKIVSVVCDTPTSEVDLYRKQSTVKIKGLFWGCDCETIADPIKATGTKDVYGYILWNETTKEVIESDFSWKLLHRIDKKLKKAEGAWTVGDVGDELFLTGGGFGSVKDDVSKANCTLESVILNNMSGNVAGWMLEPVATVSTGTPAECSWCKYKEGEDAVVAYAPGWSLCACEEASELTAVSGTWKLKYLSSSAKKLSKIDPNVSGILTIYSFPSYVSKYLKDLD